MPRGARLSAEGPLRPPSPRSRVLRALGAARLAGGNHGSRGKHRSEGHAAPTVGQGAATSTPKKRAGDQALQGSSVHAKKAGWRSSFAGHHRQPITP
jgi:hypothetical protein